MPTIKGSLKREKGLPEDTLVGQEDLVGGQEDLVDQEDLAEEDLGINLRIKNLRRMNLRNSQRRRNLKSSQKMKNLRSSQKMWSLTILTNFLGVVEENPPREVRKKETVRRK